MHAITTKPSNALLRMGTYVPIKAWTWMCIATSFVTVPPWNRCPSVGEGWYLVINEKKNDWCTQQPGSRAENDSKWKNPMRRVTHRMFLFIQHSWKDKSVAVAYRLGAVWAQEQVVWKGSGWSYKRATEGIVWWWKCLVSRLCQRQHLAVMLCYRGGQQ